MTELESYLTLSDAARKYGISTESLTRLVRDGIVRLTRTSKGEVAVSRLLDKDEAMALILAEIQTEQCERLREATLTNLAMCANISTHIDGVVPTQESRR